MTAANTHQNGSVAVPPSKKTRVTHRHRKSAPDFAPELFMTTPMSFCASPPTQANTMLKHRNSTTSASHYFTDIAHDSLNPAASFSRSHSDPLSSKFWSGQPDFEDVLTFEHPDDESPGKRANAEAKKGEPGNAKAESKRERRRQQNRTAQQVYRARQTSMLNSYRCQRDHARAEVAELRRRASQQQQTQSLSLQILRKDLLAAVENFEKSLHSLPLFPQQQQQQHIEPTDSDAESTFATCQHIQANMNGQQSVFRTNLYDQSQMNGSVRFKADLQQQQKQQQQHQKDTHLDQSNSDCGMQPTVSMAELDQVSISDLMAMPTEELQENTLFVPMCDDSLNAGLLSSESSVSSLDSERCRQYDSSEYSSIQSGQMGMIT